MRKNPKDKKKKIIGKDKKSTAQIYRRGEKHRIKGEIHRRSEDIYRKRGEIHRKIKEITG